MIQKIFKLFETLENCWMNVVREEQKEYNKSRILEPNDGSDWKREWI